MQKLIATFIVMLAVALLIIVGLGFYAQHTIERSSTFTARVLRENYDSVTYMDEIVAGLSQNERQILSYLAAAPDLETTPSLRSSLIPTQRRIETAIEQEMANITLPGEQEAARKLHSAILEYRKGLAQFFDSIEKENITGQTDISGIYLGRYQREIQPLTATVLEKAKVVRKMNQSWMEQMAKSQAGATSRFITFATVMAVVLMLAGGVYLVTRLHQYAIEFQALRTHFIAMASHELRTPLTSIKMAFDLLISESLGSLNEEQHAITEAGAEDCDRLLALSRQLLDVTKAQSGQLEMRSISIELRPLVSDSVTVMRRMIEEKRITVALDVDLPFETRVKADPVKTTWVITNLLANALRYAPFGGTVQVSARVCSGRKFGKSEVTVSVSDNGPGISQRIARQIFKPYYQASSKCAVDPADAGQEQDQTVGLGLAIAQEIVAAQGGRIWVEPKSFLAQGASITFTLPIAERGA